MPRQFHQLQILFVNGLKMQFTTHELLRMFARRESVTALLIWAAVIFLVSPFEPAGGYPLEVRVLLWGSLLPLLFGLYLSVLILAARALETAFSLIAHLSAAIAGAFLLPLAQKFLPDAPAPEIFNPRAFLFTLIASILLELVMATYLSYDKRLRDERRARARAEAQLTPPPDEPQKSPPLIEHQPQNPLVVLLGRPFVLSELLLISAEEHYVRIHTTRGQELLRGRISDLEAQLPPQLGLRVHRSHWVATSAVARLHRKREGWSLTLTDGSEVPVARPRRDSVRDWLKAAQIPG